MTNQALRRSAAHMLVEDVDAPQLDDGARHHLAKVLRLRSGQTVTVTDGRGAWRLCVFTGADIEAVGDVVRTERPDPALTLAVAPPKGDRLEWLVGKCTEVGIDRIVLLQADRSVVRWSSDRAARQLARLRRVAAEAAMQSRRVWLTELEGPVKALSVLPDAVAAEPGGRPVGAEDMIIAVGPEGGWSQPELDAAADTVSLGPHVLRVETAAVAAAVLMVSRR